MRGVDYTRGLIHGVTRVKENVSLSVEGPIQGKLIDREIWYFLLLWYKSFQRNDL